MWLVSSMRRQRNFGLKRVFISIIAIVSIVVVYLNWTALNFIVTELQCSRRADTGLRSKPLAYSKATGVYMWIRYCSDNCRVSV